MAKKFYMVDVFAESKYAGNQLAVFRQGSTFADSEMQKIAREMNFSETTFVMSEEEKEGGFDVRIFTPKEELPFAGHPVLGTAYVIQQEIIKERRTAINLNLKVGQIPVALNYENGDDRPTFLRMTQKEPVFGTTVRDSASVATVLGIDPSEIDPRFPIQEVSTGFPFLIVPLRGLGAVKKCRPNRDKYFDFIRDKNAKDIHVFSRETYDTARNQLNARMFGEYSGVPEDPATGSANGCLAAYLVKHKYFGTSELERIRVEQGYEIGRPSILTLTARESSSGKIDVSVGGKVFFVARGALE